LGHESEANVGILVENTKILFHLHPHPLGYDIIAY